MCVCYISLFAVLLFFFFSSRRRHTRCALVTGVQTCALPILDEAAAAWPERLRFFPVGCGCPISYDEWLLLTCLADAGRDARRAFNARLREMIGASMRCRLWNAAVRRSEEHTSELQSLMRISYAVFCLKKKKTKQILRTHDSSIHIE